jgi:ribose 5-phosphate isomerase B
VRGGDLKAVQGDEQVLCVESLSAAASALHSCEQVGMRAGLIHDVFSAYQAVEDDDINVFCLGGKVIGPALAWELSQTFPTAHFSGAPRHQRRLAEVQALEEQEVAAQATAGEK